MWGLRRLITPIPMINVVCWMESMVILVVRRIPVLSISGRGHVLLRPGILLLFRWVSSVGLGATVVQGVEELVVV